MLQAGTLLEELQRFADPAASAFAAWPNSRADARRKWAHAFLVYVDDMVDKSPVLTPTAVTLVFTAVEESFFTAMTLDNTSVEAAATDFANAWRAAIGALLPGASASAAGGNFTFAQMDPFDVDARRITLHADLVAAFGTARGTRQADLAEIAQAFHRATDGLKSTPSPYPVVYG